jgi:predicted permease
MSAELPRLVRFVVRACVSPDDSEEVEGDLLELFRIRTAESGAWRAQLRCWHDAATVIRRRHRLRRVRSMSGERGHFRGLNTMLINFVTELRYAARVLIARPAYAIVAILTLALGIGVNVAIFTVVNSVLLRPLPFPRSERIIEIRHHAPGLNMPEIESAPGLIARYARSAPSLAAIAGYRTQQLNLAGVATTPERVRAVAVSPELFEVLAMKPAAGRPFRSDDAQPNAAPVAIVTHAFSQSRFGGEAGLIGRTVLLDGSSTEIIGVMPPEFVFPDSRTAVLIPLRIAPGFGSFGLRSLARLRDGVPLEAARQEVVQLQSRIPEWFPELSTELLARFGWGVSVERWLDRVVADIAATLWILFATVGFVLLMAAANVANVFLVRAESRRGEIALRVALGASRGRIAAMFIAESLILAMLGGLGGVAIARAATRLLVAYGPAALPRLHEVTIDATVLAFAVALSVATALALGTVATLTFSRRPVAAGVREAGRGSGTSRARHRVRRALIVAQVAIAAVVLVASGLMLRSVMRLHAVSPGFRADDVVTTGVSLGTRVEHSRAVGIYRRVLDEIATIPGVTAAGGTSALPLGGSSMSGSSIEIRSRPAPANGPPLFTIFMGVTDGYFETLGVPLREGRLPVRADLDEDRPVAWVSETFARRFLGNSVLGESVHLNERWLEVVGVVGDVKTFGLQEDMRPMMYVPLSNRSANVELLHAVIRTSLAPGVLAGALRQVVDRVDSSAPLTAIRTMEEAVAGSMAGASFTMVMLAIAAALAVVLGFVGLYGVISYVVAERAAEIGIRLALGADPRGVRLMVLRQALVVAAAGVVIGVVAALASTRVMASLLFEVSAYDPLTFVGTAGVLMAVSAAAAHFPARRAAAIDPLVAIRDSSA